MSKKKDTPPVIKEVKPTVTVTEAEKIKFFKSFIADKLFVLEETIFGDSVFLEFTSITNKQNLAVYDYLRKEQLAGNLTNDINYVTALTTARVAFSLSKFDGVELFTPIAEDEALVDVITKRLVILNSWSSFKLAAVVDAFKGFEAKVIHLTEEVQNPNFWPADKLRS